MPADKIKSVVFDIDGSLLAPNYELTVPLADLQKIIDLGKASGLEFSLNSNRSLEGMLDWYALLGFNGVVIGEGGAYLFDPKTNKKQTVNKSKFDRPRLESALRVLSPNLSYVNTDDIIKTPQAFAKTYKKGDNVIFLEKTRMHTMTIYPRIVGSGTLQVDNTLLEKVLQAAAAAFPEFECELGQAYGNVLITTRSLTKGSLLPRLPQPVASFGDGSQDISMFEKSAFCGAPSNASEQVKTKALELGGFVSDKSYTAGAYDFIARCLKQHSNI